MGNLGSVIDELQAADPRDLPGPVLCEEIIENDRQSNRLDGLYLKQLVVVDRSGAAQADYGSTQAWVKAKLRKDPNRAARDVHLARDLTDAFPLTFAALCDGRISIEHAQVIASLRTKITDEGIAEIEWRMVDAAEHKTPQALRRVITHVLHSTRPDKAARDEQDDYFARALFASKTIDGMGIGNFTLHAAGMELFMTALNACMTWEDNDQRTPAQRRADALLTMSDLILKGGTLPRQGGVKPHVSVIVDLATLTSQPGADGAPAADYAYGATTSGEWARRFACDASVARIVFGPDGAVIDAGRSVRTFTPAQRRAIIARDRTCIYDGCDAPPTWCECHHCPHWAHGGTTSVEDGALVCDRHHDRIHVLGLRIIKTIKGPYKVDMRIGSDPNWQGHPPPHPRT